MFRGVCVDPGWGRGSQPAPDPARLAAIGIRRVRVVSQRGIEWYVEECWANQILVRAVVNEGYYCPADEYLVVNEPNLRDISPADFAQQLQIHRNQNPDLTLIAGGLADAPSLGIDAADYLRQVQSMGGLKRMDGVAIHYPATATRMAAFKKYASGLPIHVDEYNVEPSRLSDYLAVVIRPYARTADWFCWTDAMRDAGWDHDFGMFGEDGAAHTIARHWLSLT